VIPVPSERLSFAAATAALVLLAGPAARAEDWSSHGLGGTRARISGERSGAIFAKGWAHDLQSSEPAAHRALFSSPAVGDGYLVFATQRNLIRGLRELDGAKLWEVEAGGAVYSSPAILRGLAYVVGVDRMLYAIRLGDGTVAWKRELEGVGYASPTVSDGSLFLATGHPTPQVLRIEATTGKILWKAGQGVLDQPVLASVAVADGRVLVGEMGGDYHSFAAADGAWQWTVRTTGVVNMSSPVVWGGRAYLLPGGPDLRLHAVDLATGAALPGWPVSLPPPDAGLAAGTLLRREQVVSSPTASGTGVFFAIRFDERFDTNNDKQPDTFLSREVLFGVDASGGRLLWSSPGGRLETKDENALPTHGFCPTPALYQTAANETLVAVTSSVSPRLRVLGAADGIERWSTELSGTTRSSPLLANSRLVVATDAGVIHSFRSRVNHPPPSPVPYFPDAGRVITEFTANIFWTAAVDPDLQAVSYTIRMDDDGEVLRDWDHEIVTEPGKTSAAIGGALTSDRLYTYALRARDSQGSLSAWSVKGTFRTPAKAPLKPNQARPLVDFEGPGAVGASGQTITLGPGIHRLSETLRLAGGASLIGAGPHLTIIEAKGLPVGVTIKAGAGEVRGLTITGADTAIEIGSPDQVRLRNIILRDNKNTGLHVTAGGAADLANATIVRSGTGIRADGDTLVRNSLITDNLVGIAARGGAALRTGYNNVNANSESDFRNARPAETDTSVAVAFATPGDPNNLQLEPDQLTTDAGDPADEFSAEPTPNGGRVNIGAFGNTPFAEASSPHRGSSLVTSIPVESDGDPAAEGLSCALHAGRRAPTPGSMAMLLALPLVAWLARRRRR
jgi:outer membrane protein assembly factor BamB